MLAFRGQMPALVPVVTGGLALVAGAGTMATSRLLRRRDALAPASLPRVATFDLGRGELRDAAGRTLAPLTSVAVGRRMQLGSSAPALVTRWPGGSLVLARGNPVALPDRAVRRLGPGRSSPAS